LKLFNFGPSLAAGDQFQIFNQAVSGGGGMKIISPGFTVTNNLTADGSVTVESVQPVGSNQITPVASNGVLTLSWPLAWKGLHLQVQTNTPVIGLQNTGWITIPGTDAQNSYLTTFSASMNIDVFYRLAP
jgi:hypothetical protein